MSTTLATLKKDSGYVSHKTVSGIFKGEKVTYIHVYMKHTHPHNQYGLKTFSGTDGKGYLIEVKRNKSKTMAVAKKKPAAKKRTTTAAKKKTTTTAKKLCRKVIAQEGINKSTGRLKKGYKYVNGKPKKVTPKK